MKKTNMIRSYFREDELEIRVYKDKVDVINYDSIGHFDSNKVIIYYENGHMVVTGLNLVVSKLLKDEVLVVGDIKNIELR